MKNIFFFFLLITLSSATCQATKKLAKASNCCIGIENINSKNVLEMPKDYTRKCGTTQCLQLAEYEKLDCVDFKLLTRFGIEIVTFSSDIPIRIEDLARELNSRMTNLEHDGTYIYMVQYKMDAKCFSNRGNIEIL